MRETRIKAIYTIEGVQEVLEVFENKVTITPKGFLGFVNKSIRAKKEISFASIGAIQCKQAGAEFNGCLKFTIPEGIESRGGIFSATKDEDTFMFSGKGNNALAIEIREYIDSAANVSRKASPFCSL